MIAHLRGTLLEKHPNLAIVDVRGVGYEVMIPVSAFSSLPEYAVPKFDCISTRMFGKTRSFSSASFRLPTKCCLRS